MKRDDASHCIAQPPHKPATLADVAALAGVSRWVAGRVLNGGDGNSRYSEQSQRRVLKAARKLHYLPNYAARQLSGKRSHTFGLMVASAGDPLRSFLVQYLDVEAVKLGCQTLICNTIGNPAVGPDQFQHYVDEFARRGADGVLCAVHHWWPGDRAALVRRHPRTVFYEDPGLAGACYVAVDREEAVRLAVRHLVARGRQRIGLAVMTLSRPAHTARLRGYEAELGAHGRAVDDRLVFDAEPYGLTFARYIERTGRWEFPVAVMDRVIGALVDEAAADAIVAHDDFWAAALVKRMRARGIRVPDDVAVVGYLNHYLADWTDPALTTIDLCHETAARQMVLMLEKMIARGPLPEDERVVRVKPRLVIRESA